MSRTTWLVTAALAVGLAGRAAADDPAPATPTPAVTVPASAVTAPTPAVTAPAHVPTAGATAATTPTPVISSDGLEHLVPELAGRPYHIEPGVRPYLHRLAVTPGFGHLGNESLFSLRATYYPNSWLGYEGMIGHVPSHSVQAIVNRLSLVLRKPLPGRFQPYASGGYGMAIVLPGRSINADPVTKNALSFGGGLELFVRNDLALRGEMLGTTVIGRQQNREGVVAYDYREATIALTFYRTLRP